MVHLLSSGKSRLEFSEPLEKKSLVDIMTWLLKGPSARSPYTTQVITQGRYETSNLGRQNGNAFIEWILSISKMSDTFHNSTRIFLRYETKQHINIWVTLF